MPRVGMNIRRARRDPLGATLEALGPSMTRAHQGFPQRSLGGELPVAKWLLTGRKAAGCPCLLPSLASNFWKTADDAVQGVSGSGKDWRAGWLAGLNPELKRRRYTRDREGGVGAAAGDRGAGPRGAVDDVRDPQALH